MTRFGLTCGRAEPSKTLAVLRPAVSRTEASRVAYTEAGVALFHLLRQLETSLPLLSQLPISHGRMALLRSLALRGPRNLSELARERGVAGRACSGSPTRSSPKGSPSARRIRRARGRSGSS